MRASRSAFTEAYEDARLRGDAFDDQQSLRYYDDLLSTGSATLHHLSDIIATSGEAEPHPRHRLWFQARHALSEPAGAAQAGH